MYLTGSDNRPDNYFLTAELARIKIFTFRILLATILTNLTRGQLMYLQLITLFFTFQISTLLALETTNVQASEKEIVKQMVQDDLEGKSTCFQGAIKEFSDTLKEDYGGRFSGDFELYVTPIGSSVYRFLDKYCEPARDGQRVCISTDKENYLVSVNFSAATPGTFEIENISFILAINTTNHLVLNSETFEILMHNLQVHQHCKRVELSMQ